jgi:signal peptidase I
MRITIEGGEWPRRKTVTALLLLAAIAAAVVAVVLILSGGGDSGDTVTFTDPSGSMVPTFEVGDKLKVNLDAFSDAEPAIGEVVVFHPPAGAESASECGVVSGGMQPLERGEPCPKPTEEGSRQTFVKRIVAVGGDTLSIKNGNAVVNGVEEDPSYTKPCGGGYECNLPKTIEIPNGYFFMLGDNRGESDDSRYWGPIPRQWILGRVEE